MHNGMSTPPMRIIVKKAVNGANNSSSSNSPSPVSKPSTPVVSLQYNGPDDNEIVTCSPRVFPTAAKRRRVSSDYETATEQIKTEIFAIVKKPEIKLTLFSEMYSCSNCCELFYTETGLREHQQREVFNVSLHCPHCPLKKSFANRCQLLNHLKSHGVTPTVESLLGCVFFGTLPESRDYYDYSISIPTKHPGHVPTAPTTIIPSQLDVAKTEIQKAGIFLRGERQYKIIPVSNAQKAGTPTATVTMTPTSDVVLTSVPTKFSNQLFCAACGSKFTHGAEFVDHVKLSNMSSSELSVCSVDGVPTRSQCEKQLHSRIYHEKEPPFLCPECGMQFQNYEALRRHDDTTCFHLSRSLIYSCSYSGAKSTVLGAMNGVQEVKATACGTTGKFTNTSGLIRHLEQHWRDIHKCNSCPQALLSVDLLEKHVDTVHKDDDVKMEQKGLNFFQCLVCNVIFFTRILFREHFVSKLKEHSQTTLGFHCRKCNYCTEHTKQFGSHACKKQESIVDRGLVQKPPQPNGVSGGIGHRCVYCKKLYPTVRTLKRHQPTCDLKSSVVAQRKPVVCKLCSKTLQGGPKSFLAHGVTHLNAGMNICLFCNNKRLSDEDDLDTHLSLHAKNIKTYPHECRFCEEKVGDINEAHEHFASHHEKSTNCFKCATCGVNFNSVPELTTHKTTAHGVKSAPVNNGTRDNGPGSSAPRTRIIRPAFSYSYQCKYCPERKFQTRPGLRKHLRNHHPDLDFATLDWAEMRKITRTSTSTGGSTAAPAPPRRSLRDRRSSNAGSRNRTATPTLIGTHSVGSSDEDISDRCARVQGKFHCLRCIEQSSPGFISEANFFQHIREVHVWEEGLGQGGDHPFWCPECGLEFVAKPSFKMHLIGAHPFIRNVSEYMDDTGYGKEKPVKTNQCSVCRMQCPNADEYESHIRTHGMAFLKQRIQRASV